MICPGHRARLKDLETFEGIKKTAELYHQWSNGKMFYLPDSLFNFTQIGCKQLGSDFLTEDGFDSPMPIIQDFEELFEPAVLGHVAIYDGYASDLAKTGEVYVLSSTAGVVFFSLVLMKITLQNLQILLSSISNL